MNRYLPLSIALLTLGLAGAQGNEGEKPLVYVPVLPYEYLFERLGGDWIEVRSIVGEGDDCHDYSPPPRQLAEMAKANLIFTGDLGFEGNFFVRTGDGHNAPREINLLEGLDLLEGSCEVCLEAHQKGEEEPAGHDHEDLKDPHVWLSPQMLTQQAKRVSTVLKEHTPDEANADIDANLQALINELASVDRELSESLAPLKGETFYVYHGAFAYFALAYGLTQKAVEVKGRRPTPKQLTEMARQARKDNVHLIFVQPQFDQSSANSLASTIGGQVQTMDPLEKDVIGNLRTIASLIRESR